MTTTFDRCLKAVLLARIGRLGPPSYRQFWLARSKTTFRPMQTLFLGEQSSETTGGDVDESAVCQSQRRNHREGEEG